MNRHRPLVVCSLRNENPALRRAYVELVGIAVPFPPFFLSFFLSIFSKRRPRSTWGKCRGAGTVRCRSVGSAPRRRPRPVGRALLPSSHKCATPSHDTGTPYTQVRSVVHVYVCWRMNIAWVTRFRALDGARPRVMRRPNAFPPHQPLTTTRTCTPPRAPRTPRPRLRVRVHHDPADESSTEPLLPEVSGEVVRPSTAGCRRDDRYLHRIYIYISIHRLGDLSDLSPVLIHPKNYVASSRSFSSMWTTRLFVQMSSSPTFFSAPAICHSSSASFGIHS